MGIRAMWWGLAAEMWPVSVSAVAQRVEFIFNELMERVWLVPAGRYGMRVFAVI